MTKSDDQSVKNQSEVCDNGQLGFSFRFCTTWWPHHFCIHLIDLISNVLRALANGILWHDDGSTGIVCHKYNVDIVFVECLLK